MCLLLLGWSSDTPLLLNKHPPPYGKIILGKRLSEWRRALGYQKLRDRIHPAHVQDFVNNIGAIAIVVPPVTAVLASPDPDDNLILATAIAGRADLIVSGDKSHMLTLGDVEGIPIVTPRDALSRLEAEDV